MVQRMAMVIGVKPDRIDEYKKLHATIWPDMQAALKAAHISNYSIYLRDPDNLLFGYWEYGGDDFASDMATLSKTEVCKRWLALTDLCQVPLDSAAPGEWWSYLSEVFHLD